MKIGSPHLPRLLCMWGPKLSQEGWRNCVVMFPVAMPSSLARDYLKEEGFVLADCLRAQNGEGMARGADVS